MKGIKLFFTVLKLILISEFSIAGHSLGSEYNTEIGLRAGKTSGVTFKINKTQAVALECIAGLWSMTALCEKSSSVLIIDSMKWYYGGGGHLAFAPELTLSRRGYIKEGMYWTGYRWNCQYRI
jgi:hypothetical protein